MTRTQRFEFASIRPGVLAALTIAILIPIAIVVYALVGTGGSHSAPKTAPPQSTASKPAHKATVMPRKPTQSALYKAVVGVNSSMFAQGMMPPSACKAMSSTMVTCTQPVQAINFVTFRTFPSLKALYAAYVSRVTSLSGHSFRSDYGNCTEVLTSGERAWNHNDSHPISYPFSLFPAGKVTDDQAAGRLFCTFFNDQLHLVWTQNDGRLLAELSGAPHYDAYVWWRQVHHEIVLAGSPSMQSMSGMSSSKQ